MTLGVLARDRGLRRLFIGFWGSLALVGGVVDWLERSQTADPLPLCLAAATLWACGGALHALSVFALTWRFPVRGPRAARRFVGVAGVGMLVCGATTALTELALRAFFPPNPLVSVFLGSVIGGLILSTGHIGLASALDYFYRARERELAALRLEAQLAQARLDVLRMQVNPRLLFDTFGLIARLMRSDVAAADHTLARLGEMLRLMLRGGEADEVALHEELAHLRLFLEIEETRHAGRLRVEWEVEPGAETALVPALLLLPLAEALARRALAAGSGGRFRVRAARAEGRLEVEMVCAGPAPAPGRPADGLAPALERAHARLERLHGADFALEGTDAPGGGAAARLRLPLRAAGPATAGAFGPAAHPAPAPAR